MNLAGRVRKIEQSPAAVAALKKREARDSFLRLSKRAIDMHMLNANYFGGPESERERLNDMVEHLVLSVAEAQRLMHYERDRSQEKTMEVWRQALSTVGQRLTLEWYGREITPEEFERECELWAQLQRDREAGIPSKQSAAVKALKQIHARWPRIKKSRDLDELDYPAISKG